MRIRTVKPEFWTHPVFSRLDDSARLMAIGLLNLADDEGVFVAHPTIVRNALRAFDEDSTKTREVLDTLSKVGWIEIRYHPEQGPVGKVVNFTKHQRIDRPSPSKLQTYFDSSSPRRSLDDHSLLERNGKEQGSGIREQGKEVAAPIPSATKWIESARPILHLLNELSGRKFREIETNLGPITERLKEPDVTVEGVMMMIRRQVVLWKDNPKMAEFLRPETLFRKSKFDSYYASRELPATHTGRTNGNHGPNGSRVDAGIAGREQWERDFQAEARKDGNGGPPGWDSGEPAMESEIPQA